MSGHRNGADYRLGDRKASLVAEGCLPGHLFDFLSVEVNDDLERCDELLNDIAAVRRGRAADLYRSYDVYWIWISASRVAFYGDVSLAAFERAIERTRALFSRPAGAEPDPETGVVWEAPDVLRLVDRGGREPHMGFLDRPPVWAAVAGFEGCVDWPPASDQDGWETATEPPIVGRRYEVAVRFPFQAERGGRFWTLFEAAPEVVNGWEHDRPEGPDLLRLVQCRYVADVAVALDRATIAVEVMETLSLADLAALPVLAPSDAAFHEDIVSGWAPPLENRGLRTAVDRFEQVSGDFGCSLYRTADPAGGEVLVYTFRGLQSSFFWAGRRALSADEAAIIARGSDPY